MIYRLATPDDANRLAEIAHSCAPVLTDSFTLQLGLPFQRVYYRAALDTPSTVAACVEDERGVVVGFALATLDSAELVATIRKSARKLGFAALGGLLTKPKLLWGLVERVGSLLGRDRGEGYIVGHGAKVSFLAVDQSARTGQAGPRLMRNVIAALREAGAGAIAAEVDLSNPRVIRLHQRLGAEIAREFVTPSGVARVILEYPSVEAHRAAA